MRMVLDSLRADKRNHEVHERFYNKISCGCEARDFQFVERSHLNAGVAGLTNCQFA
jgi:hypothetical protein